MKNDKNFTSLEDNFEAESLIIENSIKRENFRELFNTLTETEKNEIFGSIVDEINFTIEDALEMTR